MFEGYKLLLASKSPRRLQLVGQLGIATEVVTISANEDIDPTVPCSDISEMLAKRKSDAYTQTLANNEILLTADTIGSPKTHPCIHLMSFSRKVRKHLYSIFSAIWLAKNFAV